MKDLIYRQQAVDEIAKMMPTLMSADGTHPSDEEIFKAQEIFVDCIKTIENLPSAQKTGKWVVFEAPDELHCGLVKCPFCKEELIAKPDEYSYCPNCGADLRKQP